jgi:PHD/YefM family antitoxin component YafN of YafNO toxin-antitoxin module
MSKALKEKMYSNPVSISLFNKGKASKIFDEVSTEGSKVVLKNNKPVGVILTPELFISLQDRIEDLTLLLEAYKRVNSGTKKTVSFSSTMDRLGLTNEDLENISIDLDI